MDTRPASKTLFNFITIIFFRLTPSVVRPLPDNYHFLFPITKADVCNRPEKVWPSGLGRVAKNHSLWRLNRRKLIAG
jgi:hypothetical protein